MKVALLSDCYLPRLGGIEVQVHDLAAALRAAGHEVEIFTATPGAEGARGGAVDIVDGVPVHRLALPLPWGLPVNPFAPAELRRRLWRGGFDVAHVHTGLVSPFAWDCARVAVASGMPVAMTWHCMIHGSQRVFRATRFVAGWATAGVAMSAVSRAAAAPIRDVLGERTPITVLPNGIDVARWRPVQRVVDRSAARADGAVRVVTAMRLAGRKRPVPLLKLVAAARAMMPTGSDLHLVVYGDGPDRAKVLDYVARQGHSSWVSLPGRVTRDELRAAYADADLYLSPARLESFGIAALEARTAGLPVLARSGSGVGEFVIDAVNGSIADDDSAMAAAVVALATDPERRATMTAYNLDHEPVQSWPHVVDLAVGEYDRAIRASASSRSSRPRRTR